jgi:hypothetical protein
MLEDSFQRDAEIIRAAYAEKVQEAFKLFAENISIGQNEKSCRDRFIRSLGLMRRARDIALEASNGGALADAAAPIMEVELEPLSAEDQALIDQAVAGTTGAKSLPAQPIRRF